MNTLLTVALTLTAVVVIAFVAVVWCVVRAAGEIKRESDRRIEAVRKRLGR